jgi:basic membrane lipoprotein Med (substrate-binding protein (PBP1-ABC) superfamily)
VIAVRSAYRSRLAGLVLVAALVAAGCGSGDAGGAGAADPRSAGLAFDANGLGDLQFNDSAYKGLTEAREEFRDALAITYREPDNKGSNGAELVDQMIADRVGLIIGVGFAFSEDMRPGPSATRSCASPSSTGSGVSSPTCAASSSASRRAGS